MARAQSWSTPLLVWFLYGCGAGAEPARERETTASAAEKPATSAPAPVPAAPPDFDDPSWTRTPSRAGRYVVCWRAIGGKLPRNEDFELEVWVLRDGAPIQQGELSVNAWMPEHGHGMVHLPRTRRREDGSFLVEGMLLHMRGRWQLTFDVLEGTLAETAECGLEL